MQLALKYGVLPPGYISIRLNKVVVGDDRKSVTIRQPNFLKNAIAQCLHLMLILSTIFKVQETKKPTKYFTKFYCSF